MKSLQELGGQTMWVSLFTDGHRGSENSRAWLQDQVKSLVCWAQAWGLFHLLQSQVAHPKGDAGGDRVWNQGLGDGGHSWSRLSWERQEEGCLELREI